MKTPDTLKRYGISINESDFPDAFGPGKTLRRLVLEDSSETLFAVLDLYKESLGKIGNLHWPVSLEESDVKKLTPLISGIIPDVVITHETEEQRVVFDSPRKCVSLDMGQPTEHNHRVAVIDFKSDTKPDDQLIRRVFSKTAIPDWPEVARTEIADAIADLSSHAIRRPIK